jgi:hypothetical protein
MQCERFSKPASLLAMVLAVIAGGCSREQPAKPAAPPTQTSAATHVTKPAPAPMPSTQTTPAPPPMTKPVAGSYDEAMLWFKSVPHFRFVLDESGVHAEGEMTRPRIGQERVTFTAGGEEWRAEAGPQGVPFAKRVGGKWQHMAAPPYGGRLYQRVTLAFDPQKTEGTAQLVEPGHYRFTDANTNHVHDVWVTPRSHITRMTIGGVMELRILE